MMTSSGKPIVSYAIPVFRNRGSLPQLVEQVAQIHATQIQDCDWSIVFADDGSDDGSGDCIMELRKTYPQVKLLRFTRNFGQMAAILAAMDHSGGNATVVMAADLQDPVEEIPRMVKAWQAGNELVICHRVTRKDPLLNKLTSRLFYAITSISVPQLPPGGFDFVLMDERVRAAFCSMDNRNRFFQADLLWLGYKTAFLPYNKAKREHGKSQYNFRKRLRNALDGTVSASHLPLRVMGSVGLGIAALGFLYALQIIIAWLVSPKDFVAGWAPIMVVTLVLGGFILSSISLLGEYLWRVYDEVRKRPNYVVRETHL